MKVSQDGNEWNCNSNFSVIRKVRPTLSSILDYGIVQNMIRSQLHLHVIFFLFFTS